MTDVNELVEAFEGLLSSVDQLFPTDGPVKARARAALEALSRDRDRAGEQKVVGWRCFHCDEVFTTKDAAQEHFGLDMLCAPGCCINLAEYRRMEEVHQQHLSETDEASKTFHAMRSDHHRALIKAEQDGYDKGLADGRALYVSPAPDDARRRPVKVDVTKDWCLRMAALEGDAEIGAGSIPPDDVRQMAVAWPKEVLEFEDFINEPPQYEELKNVRDYRHELYPKWQRVLTAIRSLATAPPAADPRDAVITDEMIDAGKEALRDHTSSYFDGHDEVGSGAVEAIIRAALRASSEKEQKA